MPTDTRPRQRDVHREGQRVTDAKTFKAAKKKLGINSRRDGFGRGGEWVWELPTTNKVRVVETAADLALMAPATVVYDGNHSRPDDCDQRSSPGSDDGQQGDPILLERIRGVARLDQARAPRDVPLHRWQQLVNDCRHFMTSPDNWAARAA